MEGLYVKIGSSDRTLLEPPLRRLPRTKLFEFEVLNGSWRSLTLPCVTTCRRAQGVQLARSLDSLMSQLKVGLRQPIRRTYSHLVERSFAER
jgi:hypothetical protein